MDEAVKAELARLRDEDNRQNHRIDDLEQSVKGDPGPYDLRPCPGPGYAADVIRA